MIGKFYNINSQTLASGAIIPLATSRVCGCGIRLEGNEIVISEPGTYLVNVSVTASQTSTTAQGVRLLVSTPSGVTVQSEGGSASSSDATAGNITGEGRAIQSQLADCCCTTQRAIDSLKLENCQNTQKILDAITTDRMAQMQNQINQLQMQNALCGVVRYPMASTWNAGSNPFCGCAC